MSTNRLRSHLLLLAVVAFVISAEFAHALPYPQGVSKAVYYSPGKFKPRAVANGVWRGYGVCYVSSPLSNDIGSWWELSAYNRKLKRVVTVKAIQADVSQPKHRKWQLSDKRLIETSFDCMRWLTGGHPAPNEAKVTFKQVQP